MRRKPETEYRLKYAYDSETTNLDQGIAHAAFPVLHQLGMLDDTPIADVTADDVEDHVNVVMYRHAFELYERLDEIVNAELGYVPVMACHNLAFDMYGIASWLDSQEDVRVLAKSTRKPITFTVMRDGKPRLVIWDTLVFAQKPLSKMGSECGYAKADGSWDYSKVRTPDTPLTHDEETYAKRDIYALFAWIGYYLRRNPDIKPGHLGLRIVTKTGVVRMRCNSRFGPMRGNKMRNCVANMWLFMNRQELPKTDDELFTMRACTRGGFTFCASEHACVPYDLDGSGVSVYGYDATSQHPSMIVGHRYPVGFHETSGKALELAFSTIAGKSVESVLERWQNPFGVAFNACFRFENLRPKAGSVFARHGIYPLASARFGKPGYDVSTEDNESARLLEATLHERGYCDYAEDARFAFGKLESACVASVYVTELTAWEMARCYEWDSVEAVHGYLTTKFVRPTDMSVISVMQFYQAKNLFKHAIEEYSKTGTISNPDELKAVGIPSVTVEEMLSGTAYDIDVSFTYLGLKADLNALFGINATSEFRRDTVLGDAGIEYAGEDGICNAPKTPKCWYQFGQRIVGWSRIAQVVTMELAAPHVTDIVNGDTDSIKFVCEDSKVCEVDRAFEKLSNAIDKAKSDVCARVRIAYPRSYDELDGIGHYVREFSCKQYCASWNKAYVIRERGRDGELHCKFTLAGIPTKRRMVMGDDSKMHDFPGIDGIADSYCAEHGFSETCNLFLGFNVTYSPSLMRLNMRSFPEWGSQFVGKVTDYLGNTALVAEPSALNLHPMGKTVNDTATPENAANMAVAVRNNPCVNVTPKSLYLKPDGKLGIIDMEDIGL